MRFLLIPALIGFLLVLCMAEGGAQSPNASGVRNQRAVGYVFYDENGNGVRDAGERGLQGIRVSNGREVVRTDLMGSYSLPVGDDTALFVIKPMGWRTPASAEQLPRFFYLHKPEGSPDFRYAGVDPTGPLPGSVDFALVPQREAKRFEVIMLGDTQTRNQQEVDYLSHDILEELRGTEAAFGVTLGDIVFDDLSVFPALNRAVSAVGIPWYNVMGNHDGNYDAPNDELANETYESFYGPSYYSFDYGPVHFVVLDDVIWTKESPEDEGKYFGGLGEAQIEFLRNDLTLVPTNQLVVFLMHIPIVKVRDREEVYRLLEDRPYTLSFSAHEHTQEHRFLTREDGWKGETPHHHVIHGTACGSWWTGPPDEAGIPMTPMADGAPNGYSIVTFDGHGYSIEYRVARAPAGYQMNVHAPEAAGAGEAASAEVVVNVFAGSERSKVEMRLGENGAWIEMQRAMIADPYYTAMKEREQAVDPLPWRGLPRPEKSNHIWRAGLPANPPPGVHLIHVRTTDMFGHTYTAARAIRIE